MLRITNTENGMVQGYPGTDARITVFKGIPYAAPTCGENRWRPPQPAANWEGVRKCYEFGPITMQKTPGENPDAFYSKEWHVDPEVAMGEDSLRLNIWTPAKTADEKLPVMIWIFGGGLREGYAHEMEFDGERIASRGVILVSVAYRLNAFGFLCHPDITAENPHEPANHGLLDQRFAMEWVKRNIANFGGDPNNVTIFGQSAGGGSTWAHLCSPKAKGAFNRAIVESASGMNFTYPKDRDRTWPTLEQAEQTGVKFLKEWLGVDSIAEARKLDAQFIEDQFQKAGIRLGFTLDNEYEVNDFHGNIANNTVNPVPFMSGNTTDEFTVGPKTSDEAEVAAWIADNFGEYADEYMAICKDIVKNEGKTLKQAATVCTFELGIQLAMEQFKEQGRDPYYYIFGPTIPGDDAGAFHSCDLWFEFETLMKCWRPFDGHHYDIARKMCNYWTNFAKTGNPNGLDNDGTPMPEWKPFTKETPVNMGFYDEVAASDGTYSEKRKFLLRINQK